MKKLLSIAVGMVTLFSCNESTSPHTDIGSSDSTSATLAPTSEQLITTGCYGFHQNGDDINFTISSVKDSVVGDLQYAIAEKDKNSGKFSGMVHGNKLIGTYRFASEGMISNREMAFRINNNTLVEGFGDINETSSGVVFKDTAALKYDVAMPLVKDSCR